MENKTKLYVGNLSYTTSVDELKEAFAQFGAIVDATIVTFKDTGKSKGFGFIEFETEEDTQKAMEGMNGKDFGGRNLVVNLARPMKDREER